MFSTELKSPEQVSRESDDDLHQRIQAGDEATIDSLGALDYRGFEGREDMIAQVMTEMVNQKEILPGTGPVTDDLMIKMKSALLKDEARLLMTWIFYVRKAEACCKQEENFTTNSHGQRVPKYFEGLSLQEQCRFMKEAMHETGVMELFQEIVQQNSEEVAATTTPLQAE